MELLRQAAAKQALTQLLSLEPPILSLATEPLTKTQSKIAILAVATSSQSILIDASEVSTISQVFTLDRPWSTYRAKTLHQQLLTTFKQAPARWACLEVNEQLIQGGQELNDLSLHDIAERYGFKQLPKPQEGLQALAAYASCLARILQEQIKILKRDELLLVSKIEAGAVAPLAEMEYHGLPFNEQAIAPGGTPAKAKEPLPEEIQKLLPYVKTTPQGTSRIHTTFKQLGASTGRIACHSPNLQGVNKDSHCRQYFRSEPGYVLVMADYQACELGILAEYSLEPLFIRAFQEDIDLHAAVAEMIFNTKVTKQSPLRAKAKIINFGIIYGMSPHGLAKILDSSETTAAELLNNYLRTFPQIQAYLTQAVHTALTRGYTTTLAKRRLYLPNPHNAAALEPIPKQLNPANLERIAKNMPIQGTGADILKLALARVRKRLLSEQPQAHLIHCIHDSLLCECPAAAAPAVQELLTQEMNLASTELLKHVQLKATSEIHSYWA